MKKENCHHPIWNPLLVFVLTCVPMNLSNSQPIEVKVNQGTGYRNETMIAVNPLDSNYVVAGSHWKTTDYQPAYYRSTDVGYSWSEGILPLGGSYEAGVDPSVCYDRGGNVYFGQLSEDHVPPTSSDFARDNGLFVNRSTDNGTTWLTNPFVVEQNGDGRGTTERTVRVDKPYLACDAFQGSPYENNLYVAWVRGYKLQPSQIYFGRLLPDAPAFSDTQRISDTGNGFGPVPAVGPNGIVYVAWFNSSEVTLKVDKSIDGGVNFGSDKTIVTGIVPVEFVKNVHFRAKSYPSIAVDNSGGPRTGYIYVVWADKRNGEPDIFLTASTNQGQSWSAPRRVNTVSTNDQWAPWIAVAPNGILNVVYYDSRSDSSNLLTNVYVATSVDGGANFTDTRVNSQSFNPTQPENFIGDYIGIAALATYALPFWTDTRSGTTQDVYIAYFEQPVIPVTVEQKLDTDVRVGTLGRWNGTSFGPRFNPGQSFDFVVGAVEVLHGDTNIYSSQKYNRWVKNQADDDPDVRNHHEFQVSYDMVTVTSRLKATFGGIAVKTDLLDAPGATGDSIQFRDPWFIDYPDPIYGNNKRNRGQDSARWYPRKSPFYPDTNTAFGGNVYKGAFLNQPIEPGKPYYSLSAKQSIQISGFTSYFQKWSGSSASFQDSFALQSPVVFTSGSAVATAKYKAHLGSSSSSVTAPNMQRKIIRDASGNYHMVYESGGAIWYTRSTNGGTTLLPEAILYEPANGYLLRNPTITVQNTPHRILAVCETYNTLYNERSILLRTIDPASGTMLTDELVWSDYTGTAVTTPLVASGIDNSYEGYVIVAWYDSVTGTILSRVRRAPDGPWGSVTTLRTAQASGLSLAPVINAGDRRWHLVWIEGGNLYHGDISIGLNPALTLLTIIAYGAPEIQITNPSVVNQNGGWPGVAWEEYNDEINKRVIKYRERIGTTSWSTTKVFSDASANPGFRTPSVTGHETVSNVSIAWRKGTSKLKYVQRIGGVWGSQKNLATGVDPMTSVGWQYSTSELVLSRGATAPYPIQQTTISYGSGQGPLASNENALDPMTSRPEGRGGKLIFPGGFINLAVLRAQIDTLPLPFAAVNDTVPISTLDDFITALTSTSFTGRGTLTLELLYSASGEVPPGASFRLVAKDARTKKAVLVPRIFTGIRDTILTISVPLNFPNRTIELALVPQGIKDDLVFEVERWFIDTEATGLQPELVASTSTGTSGNGQQVPTVYLLGQNFPNPFNPTTVISYQLPEGAYVAIRLYDVLGQEVQTLVDDVKEAGHYQITLDASRLASGIYFYKMLAGSYTAVRKIVVMK